MEVQSVALGEYQRSRRSVIYVSFWIPWIHIYEGHVKVTVASSHLAQFPWCKYLQHHIVFTLTKYHYIYYEQADDDYYGVTKCTEPLWKGGYDLYIWYSIMRPFNGASDYSCIITVTELINSIEMSSRYFHNLFAVNT